MTADLNKLAQNTRSQNDVLPVAGSTHVADKFTVVLDLMVRQKVHLHHLVTFFTLGISWNLNQNIITIQKVMK